MERVAHAGDHGTRRIRIAKDGVNEIVESLGETDSGSPEVLSSFISWAAVNYPADRYALILWNHGGGWEPTEVDRIARSVASKGYSEREITERSSSPLGRVLFRSSLQKIFSLSGPAERAICSDDGFWHFSGGAISDDTGVPVIIANPAVTEIPGMKRFAGVLRKAFPELPVHFIDQGCPYQLVKA